MTHCTHLEPARRLGITAFFLASAGWIMSFETAHAQDAGQVTIDARRCIGLESPEERLACFDAQVEAAASGERQSSSPTPAAADAPDSETVGTITSLRLREPNQYLITLDSGQVWSQRVAERYPLRVGQRVRIYESKWGSSQRLEADGVKGFIQVELVR